MSLLIVRFPSWLFQCLIVMADIAKDYCITLSLECNPQGFACARLPDAMCTFNPFYAQTGVSKIPRHEAHGFLYPPLVISCQGLISLFESIGENEVH